MLFGRPRLLIGYRYYYIRKGAVFVIIYAILVPIESLYLMP